VSEKYNHPGAGVSVGDDSPAQHPLRSAHALKAITVQSPPTRFQTAFLEALLIALVISFSPWKGLSYALPWITVSYLVLRGANGSLAMRSFLIVLAWAVLYGLHAVLLGAELSHTGMILSLITYSGFALLAIPAGELNSEWLRRKIVRLLCLAVWIETPIGLIQAAYGYLNTGSFDASNGDYVEGTIDIALEASKTFANPIFGTLMAAIVIALLPAAIRRARAAKVAVVLASIVLVFASVVHVLVFLVAAGAGAYLLCRPKLGFNVRALLPTMVAAVVLALSYFAIGDNLRLIAKYSTGLLESDYPRTIVTVRAFRDLPDTYPWAPFCGVGPGQFCSRAALMSTGIYLGGINDSREVPLLGTASPGPFEQFVKDLYIRAARTKYYGSTQQPFYSWLSLITEFGWLPAAFLAIVVGKYLISRRKLQPSGGDHLDLFAATALILFFVALGGQENYWEIPQAITLPLLLYKVFSASSSSIGFGQGRSILKLLRASKAMPPFESFGHNESPRHTH
jgi:hypothetical protein